MQDKKKAENFWREPPRYKCYYKNAHFREFKNVQN